MIKKIITFILVLAALQPLPHIPVQHCSQKLKTYDAQMPVF